MHVNFYDDTNIRFGAIVEQRQGKGRLAPNGLRANEL